MSNLDDVIDTLDLRDHGSIVAGMIAQARTELVQLRKKAEKVDKLETADKKYITLLREMLDGWRDYAKGHYCQTYNIGMAEGLESAALALEAFLDGWEKSIKVSSVIELDSNWNPTMPYDGRK